MRLPVLVYAEARHRDRDGWCQVLVINSEETIGSSGLRWRWGRRCAVNQSVLEDGHWAFGKLALGALSGGRGLALLPQDAENQFWCVTLSQCHSSGEWLQLTQNLRWKSFKKGTDFWYFRTSSSLEALFFLISPLRRGDAEADVQQQLLETGGFLCSL